MARMQVSAPDFDWSAVDAMGPAFLGHMSDLRERHPVFWSENRQAWLVTRYEDVQAGLRDPNLSNERFHVALDWDKSGDFYRNYPSFSSAVLSWLINKDAPDHTRSRKLLIKPFSRKIMEGYRPVAQQVLNEILARVQNQPRVNYFQEVAMAYPATILLRILGFDQDITTETILGWASSVTHAMGAMRADAALLEPAERTIVEINAVMRNLIERRRADPGDDLLSQMILASEDGDALTSEEVVALFHVLLIAGFQTSGHTINLVTLALDEQPDKRQYIKDHLERMPDIVEELSRYVAMGATMPRVVRDSFVWHDQQLKQGDTVYLCLASANHDPSIFERPAEIDFERPKKMNMVFAPGIHHCLGHFLASMQLSVFYETMVTRYSRIEVLTDPVRYERHYVTRSVAGLEVRFHPGDALG